MNNKQQVVQINQLSEHMGQMNSSTEEIYLTIESGQTQTLQLYDYSSNKNRVISHDLVMGNTVISHDGENITYGPPNRLDNVLFRLNKTDAGINFVRTSANKSALWRVLRQGENYPLSVGDSIKLGKVKLNLKEIVEEEKDLTERDIKERNVHEELLEIGSMKSNSCHNSQLSYKQKICRICFQGTSTPQDPLVCLCKCSGSVKFTHVACLKDWVSKTVIKSKVHNTLFYSYQQTKCELCQQLYAPEFDHQDRRYSLLNVNEAPSVPYAVFQGVEIEEESKRYMTYLIGLGQEEIMIGRNSNSNVVMKQISISRNHCVLYYRGKQLFVKDKGSKFGTLIKIDRQIQFSPMDGLYLQFQSKLFTIKQQKKLSCCCVPRDNYILRVSQQIPQQEMDETLIMIQYVV